MSDLIYIRCIARAYRLSMIGRELTMPARDIKYMATSVVFMMLHAELVPTAPLIGSETYQLNEGTAK
jgi:hypothetical protein